MTNTLTTARAALTTLLTDAGMQAVSFLPERPTPPLAIVTPGQPYLQRADQFEQFKVGLSVLLLTRTAANEVASDELDEMIATLTVAVFETDGYRLARVDAPNQFQVNNAQYLGCVADVSVTDVIEVS